MRLVFRFLILMVVILLFAMFEPAQAQTACPANTTFDQANTALNAAQYPQAITAFTCLIDANPQDAEAYVGRAEAYVLNGDWNAAFPDYMAAQVLFKGDQAFWQVLDTRFGQMIQSKPGDVSGYILRAHWNWYTAKDADALPDYEAILKIDPNNVFALTFRGSSKLVMSDGTAQADWARVLELAPDNPDVYTIMGTSYRWMGNADKALENFKQALQLKPESAFIYRGCGYADLTAKNYQQAVADFKHALDIGGLTPAMTVDVLSSLGTSYLAMYQQKEADAAFAQAAQTMPDSWWPDIERAYAYPSSADFPKIFAAMLNYINRVDAERIESQPLTVGQQHGFDLLARAQRVFSIPVDLTQGQNVRFEVAARDNLVDPLIVLVNEQGQAIAGNDNTELRPGRDAIIYDFIVTATGRYTLMLTTSFDSPAGIVDVIISREHA